jgi:hypothetical protein
MRLDDLLTSKKTSFSAAGVIAPLAEFVICGGGQGEGGGRGGVVNSVDEVGVEVLQDGCVRPRRRLVEVDGGEAGEDVRRHGGVAADDFEQRKNVRAEEAVPCAGSDDPTGVVTVAADAP